MHSRAIKQAVSIDFECARHAAQLQAKVPDARSHITGDIGRRTGFPAACRQGARGWGSEEGIWHGLIATTGKGASTLSV